MNYRYIFFDTETTGTYPDRDRIIEIAAYDSLHNKTFEALIHPGIPIPKESEVIHGITDSMVAGKPSFASVAKDFIEFCHGNALLIAHNGDQFDLPFLRTEMKKAGLELPKEWLFIDSLKWARRYRRDLPRHSLQYLRQIYGIKENRAHRALNDVMVLYEVFKAMTDDLQPEQVFQLLMKHDNKEKMTQKVGAPVLASTNTLTLFT